jgi:uncharacterized protein
MNSTPEEHWVAADGGIGLHAWVYRPGRIPADGGAPAITMAHGFAGLKHQGLAPFAERFARAGFVVIVHDHRGYGLSGGWPRGDIDPWQQVHDWRRVITYLQELDGVDPGRVGIWGTSFAGGHALVLGGSDRRIKAVVAQVPTISGYEQARHRVTTAEWLSRQQRYDDDDAAQMHGAEPGRVAVNSTDPAEPAVYHDADWDAADQAFDQMYPLPPGLTGDKKVTVRSMLNAQTYDAGPWAERVSPTPLLMIIGVKDSVIDPDLQRAAFARAGEPKQLAAYDGTHFGAYTEHLEFTAGSAEKWFTRHLTVLPVVVSFIRASCPAGSRHPGRRPGSGGRQCPGRAGWNRRR